MSKTKTIDKPTFRMVGQEAAKARLSFLIRSANAGAKFSPVLLIAQKGGGKTEIARQSGGNLLDPNGNVRAFMEVNCAEINNSGDFVQTVIEQAQQVESGTVFLDEAHYLPKSVQTNLLSTFNTDATAIRSYMYKGEELTIDLRKLAFVFATTDPQKLLGPLKDRFEIVSLEHYSDEEIFEIAKMKAEKLNVLTDDEVLRDVASRSRMSPRRATILAEELGKVAGLLGDDGLVSKSDWDDHVKAQGFKPYGLLPHEANILKRLSCAGSLPVGELAAALGVETKAIQGMEEFLIQKGWVTRHAGRTITAEGRKVAQELKK